MSLRFAKFSFSAAESSASRILSRSDCTRADCRAAFCLLLSISHCNNRRQDLSIRKNVHLCKRDNGINVSLLKSEEKVQEWEDLKESFEWENRAVIKINSLIGNLGVCSTCFDCKQYLLL